MAEKRQVRVGRDWLAPRDAERALREAIRVQKEQDRHHQLEHHPHGFLGTYVFSTDHKWIGLQYGFTALCFLLFGFSLMLLMRLQLGWPGRAGERLVRTAPSDGREPIFRAVRRSRAGGDSYRRDPSSPPQPQPRDRRGEQDRVDHVQHAPEARQQLRRVLLAAVALDERFAEVAEDSREADDDTERGGVKFVALEDRTHKVMHQRGDEAR